MNFWLIASFVGLGFLALVLVLERLSATLEGESEPPQQPHTMIRGKSLQTWYALREKEGRDNPAVLEMTLRDYAFSRTAPDGSALDLGAVKDQGERSS